MPVCVCYMALQKAISLLVVQGGLCTVYNILIGQCDILYLISDICSVMGFDGFDVFYRSKMFVSHNIFEVLLRLSLICRMMTFVAIYDICHL